MSLQVVHSLANNMTQMYSAASIYGLTDRMDDAAIRAWLNWHQKLKHPPRFINVFTAAKFEQGPNLLRQVRDALPDTTPVWRGYDGKDAWGNPANPEWTDSDFYINMWNFSAASVPVAALMWFERRVKPYLSVIRETNAVVMLLNEATPVFNATFESECMRLMGEEGVRAAAFRWATGTPDWVDYGQWAIQDAVQMAVKYKAVVGPHEYGGLKPEQRNSLINRFTTLTDLFPADAQPDVFIGEFGLTVANIDTKTNEITLDPNRGWRLTGATEAQYVDDFILPIATTYYVPKKVSFSLYSGPDWGIDGSFGVMKYQGLLDRLIDASEQFSFSVEDDKPMVTPTPAPIEIMPRPAEATIGIRMRVKSIPTPFRNLRESWDYKSKDTGDLLAGDVVRRFGIPIRIGPVSAGSSGKWNYVEKLDSDSPTAAVVAAGYVWNDRITWEPLGTATSEVPVVPDPTPDPTPEPTPEPDDLPPPPQETLPPPPAAPVVTAKRYFWVIEATDERHALIEQALMTLLQSTALFGQAMSGVKVTLDSQAV